MAATTTSALTATVAGVEVDSCLIHTGSHKSARRVPAAFARRALAAGADLVVETARGPQPRRLVLRSGRYYTRVAGGAV